MERGRSRGILACAAVAGVLLLAAACDPLGVSRHGQVSASPTSSAAASSYAGGCSNTVVTDAYPPAWAQSGWIPPSGPSWPVRWALGTPGEAVAYMFAVELVAGSSPRSDGSSNKVLWIVRSPKTFVVEGHPLGRSQPTVSAEGGPSIIDVPSAGCWSFQLITKPDNKVVSTINLEALPAGSLPATGG